MRLRASHATTAQQHSLRASQTRAPNKPQTTCTVQTQPQPQPQTMPTPTPTPTPSNANPNDTRCNGMEEWRSGGEQCMADDRSSKPVVLYVRAGRSKQVTLFSVTDIAIVVVPSSCCCCCCSFFSLLLLNVSLALCPCIVQLPSPAPLSLPIPRSCTTSACRAFVDVNLCVIHLVFLL
jgi:hypothetical protein